MNFDALFPNRFMKAGEFGGRDLNFTITNAWVEEIGEGTKKKVKALLTFEKTKKQWVMNKTNGVCLRAMFGTETKNWIGKRVTLFPMPMKDPFTGEDIVAIRVRGSPDIAGDMTFTTRVGNDARTFTMKKTRSATSSAVAAPPPPVAPPIPEPPPPEDGLPDQEPPEDMLLPGQVAP